MQAGSINKRANLSIVLYKHKKLEIIKYTKSLNYKESYYFLICNTEWIKDSSISPSLSLRTAKARSRRISVGRAGAPSPLTPPLSLPPFFFLSPSLSLTLSRKLLSIPLKESVLGERDRVGGEQKCYNDTNIQDKEPINNFNLSILNYSIIILIMIIIFTPVTFAYFMSDILNTKDLTMVRNLSGLIFFSLISFLYYFNIEKLARNKNLKYMLASLPIPISIARDSSNIDINDNIFDQMPSGSAPQVPDNTNNYSPSPSHSPASSLSPSLLLSVEGEREREGVAEGKKYPIASGSTPTPFSSTYVSVNCKDGTHPIQIGFDVPVTPTVSDSNLESNSEPKPENSLKEVSLISKETEKKKVYSPEPLPGSKVKFSPFADVKFSTPIEADVKSELKILARREDDYYTEREDKVLNSYKKDEEYLIKERFKKDFPNFYDKKIINHENSATLSTQGSAEAKGGGN